MRCSRNTFGAHAHDPNASTYLLGVLISGLTDGVSLRTVFTGDAHNKRQLAIATTDHQTDPLAEWSFFSIGVAAILNQLL